MQYYSRIYTLVLQMASCFAERGVITQTAKPSLEQVLSIKIIYRRSLLYVVFLLYVDPEFLNCVELLGCTLGISHQGKNTRRECYRSQCWGGYLE